MFMAAHHFIAHDLSVQSDLTATPEASHNASAEACLGEARALLESCREKQGLYGTDPDPDSEIKRHYTHNLAAIHVLESLRATSYDAVCIDLDLIASIKSILEKLIDPSDFLRAELYYFLSLCDKSYLVEASRFTESFLLGKSRKLVVDHWQAQVMQKKLAAERSN
jgi:hypothetical protein